MAVLFIVGRTHYGRPLEPRIFRGRPAAANLLERWLKAISQGFSGPGDHAEMWECEVPGPIDSATTLFVVGYVDHGRFYPPKVQTDLVAATEDWEGILADLGPSAVRTADSDDQIVPGQTVRARDQAGEQEGCVWSLSVSAIAD